MTTYFSSPAVWVRVGSCRSLGWVLALGAGLGALALSVWSLAGRGTLGGWLLLPWGLYGGLLLGALWAWRRQPQGWLHWDGLGWHWQAQGQAERLVLEPPQVLLDGQGVLWLTFPLSGAAGWCRRRRLFFCLQRADNQLHWSAARRAVYSPASFRSLG